MHVRLVIWRLRIRPPPGWQHSFVEIDDEIFSTVILSLRFWLKNVHNTGDKVCLLKVLLDKMTALDMTPLNWLGRKTSTHTQAPTPPKLDPSHPTLTHVTPPNHPLSHSTPPHPTPLHPSQHHHMLSHSTLSHTTPHNPTLSYPP